MSRITIVPRLRLHLQAADPVLVVQPLEQELCLKSSHAINRSHQIGNIETYEKRIEAINFALGHDDGQSHANLEQADIILVGVSRSGKTPTSLYLAMQHGFTIQ